MPNNDTGPTEQDAMFQIFREIFDESRSVEPIVIPNDLKDVIEKYERQHIMDALEHYEYNQTKASKCLGIKRTTLIAKMKKFEIIY
jgi:transcriptional regulator with PAS, ATPase and Fis domain|tara:strand:+ start:215 stop:472 length:258 start_codon:yes stop_codon:yes gene_type:complete